MRKSVYVALPCLTLAGAIWASALPALAVEPVVKTLAENATTQVLDVTEAPGSVGAPSVRTGNIIYVLSGGTLERTYSDGTKETANRKTGEAAIITEKRAYSVKNTGTTTVHLIEIVHKK
jgi:hypothetical protein